MRLLIAMMGEEKPLALQWTLNMSHVHWETEHSADGLKTLERVMEERYDMLLLHGCLPKLDGHMVLEQLWQMKLACPPRVLMLSEPELCKRERLKADCVAPMLATPMQIRSLLELLAEKKTPRLSAATSSLRAALVSELIDTLEVSSTLKGRAYIVWMLDQLIPSPMLENELTSVLYPSCAEAFQTSPAAVERCVRHAIEGIFSRGSMEGIERYFGTTVDPERGKPTNRAFLIGAAEQLRAKMEAQRYSLTRSRSPKSMVMHQSPAAPTSV